MTEFNSIELWKHKKALTLEQATCLIIGKDPSDYADGIASNWYSIEKPLGFDTVYLVLQDAITYLDLNANVYIWDSPDRYGGYSSLIESSKDILDTDMVDWRKTTIHMNALKKWLAKTSLNGYPSFLSDEIDTSKAISVETYQALKASKDSIAIENENLKFANREKAEIIANMELQIKSMEDCINTIKNNSSIEKEPINQNQSELLKAVNRASIKFWNNADKDDQDTWVTNQVVIDWLMREHKFSENIAKAAATIVRPEWAKK